MALIALRLQQNVEGEFFVDNSCIDCDLCRQIAPHTFRQAGDQAAVYHQPENPVEEFDALKALVTCPTASIGTLSRRSAAEAVSAYPELIEGGVYFCGFAAESSYGASSYLIVHPKGNVLVDSPRFAQPLVRQIGTMGGLRMILLTHRDDVADQQAWADRFHASRVLHADDAGRLRSKMEMILTGGNAVPVAEDFLAIPTPGHTRGHTVFLYRNRYLFTGDHLWWSGPRRRLYASRDVCWYSWGDQIRSMEKLLDYSFEWVLPGHGRRAHFSAQEMRQQLAECIRDMKASGRR
jgi:glyoxylase-like metal-dependent hydrolase (beta-lactamase superfamily II)/ferredoxin